MKLTLKCYECKEEFPRDSLVNHTGPRAKTGHNYCPNCLNKVLAREQFSQKVCSIFDLKAPGPRIWTERERIINKYGYTDQIIIDCLDYIYNVEHNKKLAESLCLVTPPNVEKMLQYKKRKDFKENKIINAIIDNINDTRELPQIKIRENMKPKKKTTWDDENYLFME